MIARPTHTRKFETRNTKQTLITMLEVGRTWRRLRARLRGAVSGDWRTRKHQVETESGPFAALTATTRCCPHSKCLVYERRFPTSSL